MPPTPLDVDETLASIGHRIHYSFGALTTDARSLKDEDAFSSALVNEFQRFGLWAKNLGLYNLGHSSLDYRFRDAPATFQYTRHLLVDLEKSILKIHQDLRDQKTGLKMTAVQAHTPEEFSVQAAGLERDFDETQANDESSEDEEDLMSYQEGSISGIVLENAKFMIDRLYKLSFKIRNPATRLGSSKARSYRALDEETGVDLMEQYACFDLRHVAEIVAPHWGMSPGECESHDLVQRLARANTSRRRQFGQWRRHKLKLENVGKEFLQMIDKYPNLVAAPSLLPFPRISQKGALSSPSTATRHDDINVNLDDNASAVSSLTYAIKLTEDDENHVNVPPLPEKLCTDKEFECPYCHFLCSSRLSNKMAWERHVFKDLRPYVCTYEDCAEGDQQYDNFRDWVSHEANTHRDAEWRSASPSGFSSEDLDISLGSSKSSSQPQPPKLLAPNDTSRQECPICLEENPTFHHIGLHLLKLALFALPNAVGPDGDTIMGDQGSNIANMDDQDSVLNWRMFEKVGMGSLHEDEKDGNWHEGDPETSKDVAPTEKATREDVLRLKNALQQADKSDGKGLKIKNIVAGLKPDFTFSYGKKGNNNRPASVVGEDGIAETLSFLIRIDNLEPDYQVQPAQHDPHGYWSPPNIKTGYTTKSTIYFRWLNGSMIHYPANVPIVQALGPAHSAATVFTQNPDTPHLLVVPFDVKRSDVNKYPGGWGPLSFRHVPAGKTQRSYSTVLANGDHRYIAAPGSPHWMPQLLPEVYDCQVEDPRLQSGLIGSIPLLIALAAFSAPSTYLLSVLTSCLHLGKWLPHEHMYPSGHRPERGMVVTVFYDPSNPHGSNPHMLNKLENGHFGPFYS